MKPDETSKPSYKVPITHRMTLKKQLRFYLDRRDMNATQLAKKSQVPKQSLSGWLAGSNPRDVRQVKRVADVLGLTVDHLMFGDGEQSDEASLVGLEKFLGDSWVSGVFEVRIRRIKR